MAAGVEEDDDVQTTDKRSLRSAKWSLLLRDMENRGSKEGAIGALSYLPESDSDDWDRSPEGCHADVDVEPRTFEALFTMLSAGRMPDWLCLRVKGMTYGSDPDGRLKVWDTKANSGVVPIVELSIRVPVAAVARNEPEGHSDPDVNRIALPATSADTQALGDRMAAEMVKLQGQFVRPLNYLVVAAVAVVLIVMFK